MAGLVPAIHALAAGRCPILFPQHGVTASGGGTAWMAGTSPAMTAESDCRSDLPSDEALFGQVAQQGGGAERLGLVVTVSRFVGHRRCPARKGASIITRHGRACPGHPRLGGGTLSDLFPHDGVSVSGGGTAWVAGTSPAMTAGGEAREAGRLPSEPAPQNKKYLCAIGSVSAGSHTRSSPSAVTA